MLLGLAIGCSAVLQRPSLLQHRPLRWQERLHERCRFPLACTPGADPPLQDAEARPSKWRPGTLVDTIGDGKIDAVLVDTVGDGISDSIEPLGNDKANARLQAFVSSAPFQLVSAAATLVLVASFGLKGQDDMLIMQLASGAELGAAGLLAIEYVARLWASGFSLSFALSPLMVIDALTLVPPFLDAGGGGLVGGVWVANDLPFFGLESFGALNFIRLLRALRVLRLLRYVFDRNTYDVITKAITGSESTAYQQEITRVIGVVLSILFVSAGLIWEAEHTTNPGLQLYSDAVYFSFSVLTTVGLGDIAPQTANGRLLVNLEMLAGITLIPYQLSSVAQALQDQKSTAAAATIADEQALVPGKPPCVACGLSGHEKDAAFCRRCGTRLLVE